MRSDICWLCCRIILFFSSDDFSSASSRLRRFLSTPLPRLPLPCARYCSWRLIKCWVCSSKLFSNFFWLSWNSEMVSFPSAMSLSACFNAALMTSRSWLVTFCRRASVWKCEKTFLWSAKWIGFCASALSSQSVTTGAEVLSSDSAGRVSSLQEVGSTEISCFVTRSTYTQTTQKHFTNLLTLWREGYLLPTWANLPTFWLNAPVFIRAKMKEVRTNAAILNHAHHWRSKVSEDCSSLSTSSS